MSIEVGCRVCHEMSQRPRPGTTGAEQSAGMGNMSLRLVYRLFCNTKLGSNCFAVTFRDVFDKLPRHTGPIVCNMKTQTMYLTSLILLSVTPVVNGDMAAASTNESIQLRYLNASGKVEISIKQDISAGANKSIASRDFWMDFNLAETPDAIAFEITRVKGSYKAHDMTQRLPASGLKGQVFDMQRTDENRALQRTDSDSKLEIGVGQMIGRNYPVGLAVADIMPQLPADAVTVGSRWKSTRESQWLEGWAWTQGQLITEHTVTELDQRGGHTIVSVASASHAQLSDVEGGVEFSGAGELKRSSNWRFDATDGRLLSMSIEQETTGTNTLPQGTFDVLQETKIKYSAE